MKKLDELRSRYDRYNGNTKVNIWFWCFAITTAAVILLLLL